MGPIGVRGVRVLGTRPPDLFFKCMFGILSSRAINWHSLRRNWLRWGVTLASQSCSVPNGMWAVMYAGAAAAPHAPQSSTQINKQAGQPDGCPAYIKFSSGTCKKNRAVCNNHVVECPECKRVVWSFGMAEHYSAKHPLQPQPEPAVIKRAARSCSSPS